jgi:hypothetical protein
MDPFDDKRVIMGIKRIAMLSNVTPKGRKEEERRWNRVEEVRGKEKGKERRKEKRKGGKQDPRPKTRGTCGEKKAIVRRQRLDYLRLACGGRLPQPSPIVCG